MESGSSLKLINCFLGALDDAIVALEVLILQQEGREPLNCVGGRCRSFLLINLDFLKINEIITLARIASPSNRSGTTVSSKYCRFESDCSSTGPGDCFDASRCCCANEAICAALLVVAVLADVGVDSDIFIIGFLKNIF